MCFESASASPQLHFAPKESKQQEPRKRALHPFLAHVQTAGAMAPVTVVMQFWSLQFSLQQAGAQKNDKGKQGSFNLTASPIYQDTVPAGQEVTTSQDNSEHVASQPEK